MEKVQIYRKECKIGFRVPIRSNPKGYPLEIDFFPVIKKFHNSNIKLFYETESLSCHKTCKNMFHFFTKMIFLKLYNLDYYGHTYKQTDIIIHKHI